MEENDEEYAVNVAALEVDEANRERNGDRPFYASADDTHEDYKNKHDFASLRLDEDLRPTLAELIDTCIKPRQSEHVLFEQGMWVEYRSNDMKWKVGRVNRVIKQPPDDWDFDEQEGDPPEELLEISFNVGVEGVVYEDNIRAPVLGLEALFGKRPWLWQQFCLLQLEKRLRFDQAHEYDFDEIDCLKFATTRYEAWLDAPANRDFKEVHDSLPIVTQKMLRTHLLIPFELADFVVERNDEWNFNDPDISVYTYTSLLGSGIITSFTTMMVQLITPLLILYNNLLQSDGEPSPRFEVDENSVPLNGEFLPTTTFDDFCKTGDESGRVEGKILITLVLLIYLSTVVPDSLLSFYRVSGGHKSTYSKIQSLRNIVWEQNDDDWTQEVGYKLDRLMNTGYLSVLYVIMLFVLLNTPLVLDIILNALAIEFIHQIDERIADADWWDEGNRWIRAGVIEIVLQGSLRLRVLESANKICAEYGINRDAYSAALGGMKPLYSKQLAWQDERDEKYMTDKEIVFERVAAEAEAAGDAFVVDEYRKKTVQFGGFDIVAGWFGRRHGLFQRYTEYRVWSRWEKILFLPSLPDSSKKDLNAESTRRTNVVLGKRDFAEFASHVAAVLTGKELLTTVKKSVDHGYYLQIPRKIFLGIMEWFMYVAQLVFPFIVVFCLFFIPLCY